MDISPNQVEQRIYQEFRKFVYEKCVPTLKSYAPVDSGTLRASIQAEQHGDNEYFVGTDLEYAKYTEYGRGPVFPKVKRALWWPELDHPVGKAKKVDPQHWVEDAVDKLK